MTTAHASHTITVTRLPGEDDDDLEYTTTCPPTSKSCKVWWECDTCRKAERPITEDEEGDGEYTAHGIYHQQIDSYWMTESSQCGLSTDSAQEECWDVAKLVGLGTHDVDLDYYGDGCWEVHPAGNYWTTHLQTGTRTRTATPRPHPIRWHNMGGDPISTEPTTERESLLSVDREELRQRVDAVRDNPGSADMARLINHTRDEARFQGFGDWDQARLEAHALLAAGYTKPCQIEPEAEIIARAVIRAAVRADADERDQIKRRSRGYSSSPIGLPP